MSFSINITDQLHSFPATRLPIYQYHNAEFGLLYTPGLVWKISLNDFIEMEGRPIEENKQPNMQIFTLRAQEVLKAYQSFFQSDFIPTNLTLYLNQKCNLNCLYCFAVTDPHQIEELSIEACMAGLELVAENCRKTNSPMTLVIHGGGEPLLSFHKIKPLFAQINRITKHDGLTINTYLATNGVMSVEKAHWIARHFDRIGISCDGPPEIQEVQRPAINSCHSNKIIEQTAAAIREAGKILDIRVTITPETIERQIEIVRYVCEKLKPNEIHVEPVYLGKNTGSKDCIKISQVKSFVDFFVEAEKIALQHGSSWKLSGARLNEVHTSYCHVFQQVLNLVPGDAATACFKLVNKGEITTSKLSLGTFNRVKNKFIIDQSNYHHLIKTYELSKRCEGCFLQYQCSHGCPNNCLLNHEYADQSLCAITRGIALKQILEKSTSLEYGEMAYL